MSEPLGLADLGIFKLWPLDVDHLSLSLMEKRLARLELQHGPGFGDHGSRVAVLSRATARVMGFSEREISRLWLAALVHDIGKIGIDPGVLQKTTALTPEELGEVREHPVAGHDQVVDVVHPSVAEAILCHHERWDGDGYPNGVKGSQIPMFARVILVADAYDVMTVGRDYRGPMTIQDAGAQLMAESGRQFDPRVVDAFASLDREVLAPVGPARRRH